MRLMFDLDGTLTDSREGITRCIQHAIRETGRAIPPIESLTRYVGPPLASSFAVLLETSSHDEIEAAIAAYRRRFEHVGMFENRLYPGIEGMLRALTEAGHQLSVVTAKPRGYALKIVGHFGIRHMFDDVYGPDFDAREYSKASLVRQACAGSPRGDDDAAVIGDRADDVHAAKSNGVRSIAVTWGYGDRDELAAAEPDWIVTSTDELLECLGSF